MRIGCIGDIHLKWWDDKITTDQGIPLRTKELIDAIEYVINKCTELDIEDLFLLGDINDTYSHIDARAFNLLQDLFNKYHKTKFHIFSGNHDISSRGELITTTAVDILSGPSNVIIYKESCKFLPNVDIVPFNNNLLKTIKEDSGNDILFSHFSIGGSVITMSTGSKLLSGDINMRDLDKWKLVILGDIHKPQCINKKIWYTGNLIQLTRAEAGEEKRFLVVDTDSLKVDSHPILSKSRKYHNIEITEENVNEGKKIVKEITKLKDSGDYVTIRKNTETLPDEINLKDLKVNIVDYFEPEFNSRGISSGMNTEEVFKKYIEIKNVAEKDKELYLNGIIEFLKGV